MVERGMQEPGFKATKIMKYIETHFEGEEKAQRTRQVMKGLVAG